MTSLSIRFTATWFVVLAGCSSSSDSPGGNGTTNGGTVVEGGACNTASDCKTPSDGRTAACQCTDGSTEYVCVTQLAAGAKCPTGTTFSVGCSAGARCLNGTCQIPAPFGGDCTSNLCEAGLSCNEGKCAAGKALGEKCNFVFDDCAGDNWCDFPGDACKSPAKIGEKCSSSDAKSCAPGSVCDFGAGGEVCVAIGEDGAPCTSDDTCRSKHCVRPSGGTGRVCGQEAAGTKHLCGGPSPF